MPVGVCNPDWNVWGFNGFQNLWDRVINPVPPGNPTLCRSGFATPTETFEVFNGFQNVWDRVINPVPLGNPIACLIGKILLLMGKIFSGNHLKLWITHGRQYTGIVTVETRFIASPIYRVSIYRIPTRKPTGYHLDAINRVSTEINLWLIRCKVISAKELTH